MTIEITLLLGIVCCAIGVAAFFGGKNSDAKKYGERWGRLEQTLVTMERDIGELKGSVKESATGHKDSIARLHKRIDDHLRDDHGVNRPRED